MTQYVLGFLINRENGHVVLVEKNRPSWQKGKWNGVGGHVELSDWSLADAMRREFREETGHDRDDWERYCVLTGDGFQLHVFCAFDTDLDFKVETKTDESIAVHSIRSVDTEGYIPNLTWLIPMALSMRADRARHFIIHEQY